MTAPSIALLYELNRSQPFQQAMGELVEIETGQLTEALRGYVRVGNFHSAAMVEGEIDALHSFMRRVQKYANAFQVNR